jgi:copper chaperone CopZ
MAESTFAVNGMTCEHCVAAVRTEIGAIPGVTGVEVDLRAGGTSTVRVSSDTEISSSQVAAALDEAGEYELA